MFENFGTAIVQAVGFFGVFGFFVYRLLSDKFSSESYKKNSQKNSLKSSKSVSSEKKGLFGRKRKDEQNIDKNKKVIKKGWFRR